MEREVINPSNDKTVLKKDWCEHTRKLNGARNVHSVQEFNWVILCNKKLHINMNMAQCFLELKLGPYVILGHGAWFFQRDCSVV